MTVNYWIHVFGDDYVVYIGRNFKDKLRHKLCTFLHDINTGLYIFIPFNSAFYELWIKQYALNAYIGGIK